MNTKKVIRPKGKEKATTEKISTEISPMVTSSSENSPKFSKLGNTLNMSPGSKFTQTVNFSQGSFNSKLIQVGNSSQISPISKNFKKGEKISQTNFQFGSVVLSVCTDPNKKFKPYTGLEIDSKQQCLLDNLWHIQTLPNATSFKVQILNALCFYFSELKVEKNLIPKRKFSHYVIYRGTKVGLFNNFDTVRKFINCQNPIFKGYYTFKEALDNARENLGLNFFIEPEEVKSFSQIVEENPSGFISAQAEMIHKLEKQISDLQNQLSLSNSKIQENVEALNFKDQTIFTMEKGILNLNNQIFSLNIKIKDLKEKDDSFPKRKFENFKARMLDLPYQEVLKPLFDRIPELDQIILKKASEGIIEDFINLQREIIKILFEEIKFKGVKVIQKEKYFCDPREFPGIPDGGVTGIFKLQINLNTTDMSCEDILKFYHNGMVDYIDFRLEQESSKIEDILEKLGEKFLLIGGNMASKSLKVRIFCKIQATLPQVVKGSYIPARKRIFMEESEKLRNHECATFDFKEIENSEIYKFYQQNLGFEMRFWPQYKLLGEGHFTQIFGTENWKMLLPFSGEGEKLEDDEHIINTEEVFGHQDSDTDYDEEIPDTHRDF